MKMVKVLFVCMGNICRSPTAEGVFRHVVEREGLSHVIEIDSAGTHAYHIGEPPDPRSTSVAMQRGVDLSTQRARRAIESDLEEFDFVLAMDRDNYANLSNICSPEHEHKLSLFLDYAKDLPESEVPDPYYGGGKGFDRVLDLVEAASEGLLKEIKARHI